MILTDWIFRRRRDKAQGVASLVDLKNLIANISKGSRESLEKELFKFGVAYNIAREVAGGFDLDKTLNLLVDRIAEVIGVEIVSLMLVGKIEASC